MYCNFMEIARYLLRAFNELIIKCYMILINLALTLKGYIPYLNFSKIGEKHANSMLCIYYR